MSSSLRALYEKYCQDPELLDRDAEEAVRIHSSDVEKDLGAHAGIYLHWSRLSVEAEHEAAVIESYVDGFVKNDCRFRARQLLEQSREKITESRVDEIASRDPLWLRQQKLLSNAKKIASVFKRVENAMWQRKDMLQSLNSRQSREYEFYGSFPKSSARQLEEHRREVFERARLQNAGRHEQGASEAAGT